MFPTSIALSKVCLLAQEATVRLAFADPVEDILECLDLYTRSMGCRPQPMDLHWSATSTPASSIQP